MKKPPINNRRLFKTKYKLNEQYKHKDIYNISIIISEINQNKLIKPQKVNN